MSDVCRPQWFFLFPFLRTLEQNSYVDTSRVNQNCACLSIAYRVIMTVVAMPLNSTPGMPPINTGTNIMQEGIAWQPEFSTTNCTCDLVIIYLKL